MIFAVIYIVVFEKFVLTVDNKYCTDKTHNDVYYKN